MGKSAGMHSILEAFPIVVPNTTNDFLIQICSYITRYLEYTLTCLPGHDLESSR